MNNKIRGIKNGGLQFELCTLLEERTHCVFHIREQTTHVICIYMYLTGEGIVQRSIT